VSIDDDLRPIGNSVSLRVEIVWLLETPTDDIAGDSPAVPLVLLQVRVRVRRVRDRRTWEGASPN
jgi:hypothetical protein